MKTAVSAIGLGLALLAAGCGSSPKVAAPAPPDRLHLERAGDVLPAPGLHDALLVRPRDLAAEPEFLAAIERVFPKKERLGYVEARGGVDPFEGHETVVAHYTHSELMYVRAPLEPGRVEAAATKRLLLEGRAVDGNGAVIRLFGATIRTGTPSPETALEGRQVALLSREAYVEESGTRKPLSALTGLARGRITHTFSLFGSEPAVAALADWPVVYYVAGPFPKTAGAGLLAAAKMALVRAKPMPGDGRHAAVEWYIFADYSRDPARAVETATAEEARIAESALGRLLGLDRAPRRDPPIADAQGLHGGAVVDVERLASGLLAATRGDATSLKDLDAPFPGR